jgi:hypothetical protein
VPLKPVRVRVHWSMKIISVVGAISYAFLASSAWHQNKPFASFVFSAVALLNAWVFFLADSMIDVDERGIRLTEPHGVYELCWDELESFEVKRGFTYLFGNNKAVAYNLLLAGKRKREFQEYVAQTIEKRHLPAGKPTGIKVRQLRKNAKVRGWKLF